MNMLWLILGDFNCVKSPTEKQLGATPTWYELKDFAECCISLGLNDAPTTGCYFTWYSNSESNPVWCKLDRVLFNNEWLEAGLLCNAHFNPPGCLSDHSPGFLATVENGWNLNMDGTTQFSFYRKLKALKGHLKAFNNLHFSHISVKAKDADLALQDAQIQLESDPENAAIRDSVGELRKKVVFLAEAERVVTPEEVKQALFHISENKAPSPDGYSACFFKRAWHIVGDQVCTAVLDFFRSGRLLSLRWGRSITDNIFLAQEIVRQYTRKWISPRCTINVDLCKAFDSVSWTFFSQVLHGRSWYPAYPDLERGLPCPSFIEHPPQGRHALGTVGRRCLSQKEDQFGTDNRRRAIHHSFNGLPKSAAESLTLLARPRRQSSTWPDGAAVRDLIRPKHMSYLHVTDLCSFKRIARAHYASILKKRPSTFSFSAYSVTLCGPISGNDLASADACPHSSVQ
ncbi:UNVERIFIED_CONTAM: hypothetical protein Scaly_1792000 [Sesamum calycinum]|uniref:Uncharacterized protein n=1 Tax=Sesamum calycinum TaxID=2727403 RepID=A0AAW2NV76_9LAMI